MNDKEIIARQAAKIIELEDQLSKEKETSDLWYHEAQRRISSEPMTMQETIHALANAEIPCKVEEF